MKFYLSSYKLGDNPEQLVDMLAKPTIGYVANAFNFTGANPERCQEHMNGDIQSLRDIGLDVLHVDLREHFGRAGDLRELLVSLGAVFLSGGNVFVLRQAMKLSGMDDIILSLQDDDSFVYAGYSAAGCVLSPTLDAYQIVDDATDTPYPEQQEVIMEGLGLIDFAFMPHFDSDHSESADVNKEIAYCEEHNIAYKTLRDGEVMIL